jgi:predicted RNA binding protein YcfA (HicA-like mRNA interferase family)
LKRRDLIKILEKLGCEFIRHGGKHDWYQNKKTGVYQAVPRHKEINENLAKSIIKKMS